MSAESLAKTTSTAYDAMLEVIAAVEPRVAEATRKELGDQLFVRDGRLASLEIVWYDESQMTGEFPAPEFWEPPTATYVQL